MIISVIVCTLGQRPKELQILIKSLENQTYKNINLIVVSQGEHKLVESILINSRLNYKHLISDVKGLSKGRNLALKEIQGDIITISDDDCWYPKESFNRVLSFFNKDPKLSIAVGQIFDPITNRYYKDYFH